MRATASTTGSTTAIEPRLQLSKRQANNDMNDAGAASNQANRLPNEAARLDPKTVGDHAVDAADAAPRAPAVASPAPAPPAQRRTKSSKPSIAGHGAYPPHRATDGKRPPKTPLSQLRATIAYEERLRARLHSPDPGERDAAAAQLARTRANRNARVLAVNQFKTKAAAAEWLDADTELPLFLALRRCATDYDAARGAMRDALFAASERRAGARLAADERAAGAEAGAGGGAAARDAMGGAAQTANGGGGGSGGGGTKGGAGGDSGAGEKGKGRGRKGIGKAEPDPELEALASQIAGELRWAEWQAQLVRGRRCNRWIYAAGAEIMERAGVGAGAQHGPLTEGWAWLVRNWARIEQKWDELGESEASDEEVLGLAGPADGGGGGQSSGAQKGGKKRKGTVAYATPGTAVSNESVRRQRVPELRMLRLRGSNDGGGGGVRSRELALQNVLRAAGAAGTTAGQYVREAGGAVRRAKDNLVGGVGATGSHMPSAQDVAALLQRGATSHAARFNRPFATASGLVVGPR
jgi:hypothetical protein